MLPEWQALLTIGVSVASEFIDEKIDSAWLNNLPKVTLLAVGKLV